jgi:hypothetical protein
MDLGRNLKFNLIPGLRVANIEKKRIVQTRT